MIIAFIGSCLLVISAHAASISDGQGECKAAAEQAGVDFENFKYNVGHVIHSLTVEDIRYFFDENFPVDNDIPTVNTNLSGPPVIPNAPSFPSKYRFPLGSTLDRILLNNDDPNAFFDRGLTSLEELGHAAHMLEMLFKASEVYKTLDNIDIESVCPCLVDEESNGILAELSYISMITRHSFDESKSLEEQGLFIGDFCSSKQLGNNPRLFDYDFDYCKDSDPQCKTKKDGKSPRLFDYDLDYCKDSDPQCKAKKDGNSPRLFDYDLDYCRDSDPQCKPNAQPKPKLLRKVRVCPSVPDVTDSESWKIFKNDIAGPMEGDGTQLGTDVAVYLYCKIAMLSNY